MWRKLAVVIPSVVLLGVGATATEATDLVHRHQAQDRAVQTREAQRLNQLVTGQREALQALQQATSERDAAMAKVAELQPALDSAKADNAKLKDQVAALQAASVGLGSGPAAFTVGVTAGPNHFAYGYCTYYVAGKRWIPWFGNAGTWLYWARTYGWPTGSVPRPGAIEVANLSWFGHVAWVESVNSDGTYWVTEENYQAWNVVDRRLVVPWLERLQGFIY